MIYSNATNVPRSRSASNPQLRLFTCPSSLYSCTERLFPANSLHDSTAELSREVALISPIVGDRAGALLVAVVEEHVAIESHQQEVRTH